MPTKPTLGQHFLTDQSVLARIAEASAAAGSELAVEIGPGKGSLTRHLLERYKRVVAIEVDETLAAELPEQCGGDGALEVIGGDILEIDLRALISERSSQRVAVVGNLPYYITSPILRAVCAALDVCATAVFLIQDEVATRVTAKQGSRDYGYLSCICQLHGAARKLFSVPPGAFRPPPKVDSAVVSIEMNDEPPPPELLSFLSACFRSPRKTLKNNLRGRYPQDRLADDPCAKLRAQQVSLPDLTAMWSRLRVDSPARN